MFDPDVWWAVWEELTCQIRVVFFVFFWKIKKHWITNTRKNWNSIKLVLSEVFSATLIGPTFLLMTIWNHKPTERLLNLVFLNLTYTPVTSPTVCQLWSASPSALKLSSQGATSATLCWGSTAAAGSGLSGSAGAWIWCSNRWSTAHLQTSCRSFRLPIRVTGTHCAK